MPSCINRGARFDACRNTVAHSASQCPWASVPIAPEGMGDRLDTKDVGALRELWTARSSVTWKGRRL